MIVKNKKFVIICNPKVSFEKIDDEICLYNEETNRMAVLNSTASAVFLFLLDAVQNGSASIEIGKIVQHLCECCSCPDEMVLVVYRDVKNILEDFKKESFFLWGKDK